MNFLEHLNDHPAFADVITQIIFATEEIENEIKNKDFKKVLALLANCSSLVSKGQKEIKEISFDLSSELLMTSDFDKKGYLVEISNLIKDEDCEGKPEIIFDLVTAIEELYIFRDRISALKKLKFDFDHFFNLLHEMFLDLEQHFQYHYEELKKNR